MQLSGEREGLDFINWLTLPNFCACPKLGFGFPYVFVVLNGLRWDLGGCLFADIGEYADKFQ